MCQSPAHLTVAANRPGLYLALNDHMPKARGGDQLNDGGAGLMAPGECAGARAEGVDGEAVAHDKELRVIPVDRARLVIDDSGESNRPGTARRLDA